MIKIGQSYFGLKLLELIAPLEGESGPLEEPAASEALLVRTLAKIAPTGNFSLRYLHAPEKPGQLQVAILGRVTEERGAEEVLQSVNRFLEVSFKDYWFEPMAQEEIQNFLTPFPIKDVVEITRQVVMLNIASWKIAHRAPLGFGLTNTSLQPENATMQHLAPYVFPFVPNPEGWPRLFETLLLQPRPVLIEVALWPTELTAREIQLLENEVQRYQAYLDRNPSFRPPEKPEARLSSVLVLRAELLRDWYLSQIHQLEIPGNAFWVRIRLASPAAIPPDLVAVTGQAFSRPPTVNIRSGRPYHLAGGFDHWHYRGVPRELREAISELDRDLLPIRHEPLRFIFDGQAAGEVFRLPVIAKKGRASFPGLRVRHARYLEAPEGLPGEGVRLGHAHRRGNQVGVFLKTDDHRRHVYTVGQTGVGKSSLILKMALENIRRGEGVAVIDPHGDLIQLLLDRIPAERVEDTILFDPGHSDYAIGMNLLEWKIQAEQAFLVDEFISMLKLIYPGEIVGPVFEHNVRYGLLLLMANPDEPGTLVEFPQLFSDRGFHRLWLPYVQDPLVRRFWEKEFPQVDYRTEAYLHYIISKIDPFILHPLMNQIIGQRRSTVELEKVMNEGKILLVDLAKGKLGDLNSKMLGMIVIAKLYAAAMRRINVPRSQRRDFFVYVDEFQNLATETFASILSEARKFRLNLTLCNQYITQLPGWIVQALLGNVGTVIVFRVGIQDAELLEPHFGPVSQQALADQPNHHAYVRLLVSGELTPPFSLWTELEPEPPGGTQVRQAIRARISEYARPRKEVREEIQSRLNY